MRSGLFFQSARFQCCLLNFGGAHKNWGVLLLSTIADRHWCPHIRILDPIDGDGTRQTNPIKTFGGLVSGIAVSDSPVRAYKVSRSRSLRQAALARAPIGLPQAVRFSETSGPARRGTPRIKGP
jgi:hypothetical protein